jgi:carboxymethylenebutenolidase
VVHYFDRTGTRPDHLPTLLKQFQAYLERSPLGGKELNRARTTFESWHGTVRDAVGYARRQPRVDARRVGLMGISMGGFLAVAAAAQADLRIACVAELFGGLPPGREAGLRQMPPMLIIHGESDATVPVKHAHALSKQLLAFERTCEIRLYPEVGHAFRTRGGRPCLLSALDAEQCAVSFLARHLGAPAEEKPARRQER